MNKTIIPVSFFFGVNNKSGFCSLFDEAYNPYEDGLHYILKGGPGTGKSTLMKKIAEYIDKAGYETERGWCSADPLSLDIVTSPDLNFSILDGTSPHTFDPTLPGVTEHIVDLSGAWDKAYLKKHREEIGELTKAYKLQHKKCADFLWAASRLEAESALICDSFTDRDKLLNYAKRLASREIKKKNAESPGKIYKRFLSAVTPDGIVTQYDTIVALAEKIVTIDDSCSSCAPFIMQYISDCAVLNGYDVYECYCPIFPYSKIEHIIIPELKICFFTENQYHYTIDDSGKRVHASRFFDKDELYLSKEKLSVLKKAKKELIDEAVRKLSLAKGLHDKLEEYYIKATDFNVIDEKSKEIIAEVKKIL